MTVSIRVYRKAKCLQNLFCQNLLASTMQRSSASAAAAVTESVDAIDSSGAERIERDALIAFLCSTANRTDITRDEVARLLETLPAKQASSNGPPKPWRSFSFMRGRRTAATAQAACALQNLASQHPSPPQLPPPIHTPAAGQLNSLPQQRISRVVDVQQQAHLDSASPPTDATSNASGGVCSSRLPRLPRLEEQRTSSLLQQQEPAWMRLPSAEQQQQQQRHQHQHQRQHTMHGEGETAVGRYSEAARSKVALPLSSLRTAEDRGVDLAAPSMDEDIHAFVRRRPLRSGPLISAVVQLLVSPNASGGGIDGFAEPPGSSADLRLVQPLPGGSLRLSEQSKRIVSLTVAALLRARLEQTPVLAAASKGESEGAGVLVQLRHAVSARVMPAGAKSAESAGKGGAESRAEETARDRTRRADQHALSRASSQAEEEDDEAVLVRLEVDLLVDACGLSEAAVDMIEALLRSFASGPEAISTWSEPLEAAGIPATLKAASIRDIDRIGSAADVASTLARSTRQWRAACLQSIDDAWQGTRTALGSLHHVQRGYEAFDDEEEEAAEAGVTLGPDHSSSSSGGSVANADGTALAVQLEFGGSAPETLLIRLLMHEASSRLSRTRRALERFPRGVTGGIASQTPPASDAASHTLSTFYFGAGPPGEPSPPLGIGLTDAPSGVIIEQVSPRSTADVSRVPVGSLILLVNGQDVSRSTGHTSLSLASLMQYTRRPLFLTVAAPATENENGGATKHAGHPPMSLMGCAEVCIHTAKTRAHLTPSHVPHILARHPSHTHPNHDSPLNDLTNHATSPWLLLSCSRYASLAGCF